MSMIIDGMMIVETGGKEEIEDDRMNYISYIIG